MTEVEILILALAAYIDQIIAEAKDPATLPTRRIQILQELHEWLDELKRLTKDARSEM